MKCPSERNIEAYRAITIMKQKTIGEKDIESISKPVRKNGDRVKRVFEKAMSIVASGEELDLKQIQRDEGYSEESIRCGKVFRTKTWEQMKGRDMETFIGHGFLELALPENEDKRTRFSALKELAALSDMYPGKKMKYEMINEATSKFFEAEAIEAEVDEEN